MITINKSMIMSFACIFLFAGCSTVNYMSHDEDIRRMKIGSKGTVEEIDFLKNDLKEESVYKMARRYDKLIELYKKKLTKSDNPEDRYMLSKYYYEAKDYNSALYYLEPLAKYEYSLDVMLLEAKILKSTNKDEQALDKVQEALAFDKDSSKNDEQYRKNNDSLGALYNLAGVICSSNNFLDSGFEYFVKSKELFYSDSIINTNLGVIELLRHNYKNSLGYLMPLYLRGNKDPIFLNNFVFALIKDEQREKAIEVVRYEGMSRFPEALVTDLGKLEFKNEKKGIHNKTLEEKCRNLDKSPNV